MDFLGWSALVILSLWASALAFYWALTSGQFAESDRARYLPLPEDLPALPAELPASRRPVTWALAAVVALVSAAGLAALALSFAHGG